MPPVPITRSKDAASANNLLAVPVTRSKDVKLQEFSLMPALVHIFSNCDVITLWNCSYESVDRRLQQQHSRLNSRHIGPSCVGHFVRFAHSVCALHSQARHDSCFVSRSCCLHIQPQAKLSVDMELLLAFQQSCHANNQQ